MNEPTVMKVMIEEAVSFSVQGKELDGILTLPDAAGPHPALVLLHGSDRSGRDDPYYAGHAARLVESGCAVLRYDGPGWGGGATGGGFETLEYRTQEALAALSYLQARPDIRADAVGLWGVSQGGWICQMAAAASPDVAFIIPVSGPAVTPAEQEVYRVEAESRAAGFAEEEVAKAVLLRRLLVDGVLAAPIYRELNQAEARRLGDGAWSDLTALTYSPQPLAPAAELARVIAILQAVAGERWARFLHLDDVLALLNNLPPPAWEMAKAQMRAVMEVDPADFLTKVRCPVLAIFGDKDTSIPVEKSVRLYEQYLRQAGNEAFTLAVFPNASHTIRVGETFADGYFELMVKWLRELCGDLRDVG
ncbi:MAG: alpha/beta fold hydrolase [Caldilineales bacterium]|nr:alpha/beta fold hydrolase [Caldilineales bacterium]